MKTINKFGFNSLCIWLLMLLFNLSIISVKAQLSVYSSAPDNGAINNSRQSAISVVFDEVIDSNTINPQTVFVRGAQTGAYLCQFSLSDSTLNIQPLSNFRWGEKITVSLTNQIQDTAGNNLTNGFTFQFYTEIKATGSLVSSNYSKRIINNSSYSPRESRVADMDGDGELDIVGMSTSSGLGLYYNVGNNEYVRQQLKSGSGYYYYNSPPFGIALDVSDLDNDGDLDIVVGDLQNNILWFRNDNTSYVPLEIDNQGNSTGEIIASDLDADGDMDVVASNATDNALVCYINNGSQAFSKITLDSTLIGTRSAFVADMDNDGDLDIVGAGYDIDSVFWYENTGSLNFTRHFVSQTVNGPRDINVIDLDQDGDMDILTAGNGDNKVYWHSNNNMSFSTYVIAANIQNAHSVNPMDIDGDLDLDILIASPTGGKMTVLEKLGTTSFSKINFVTNDPWIYTAISVDFNEDGFMDFITSGDGYSYEWYQYLDCSDTLSLPQEYSFNTIELDESVGSRLLSNCFFSDASANDSAVNWRITSGSTPSMNTGPNKDDSPNQNGRYVYFETSGNPSSINDSVALTSPLYNLNGSTNSIISFSYFMFGGTMGSLTLDVFDGTQWSNNELVLQGQQQDSTNATWRDTSFSLSGYSGIVQFRFKGVKGNGIVGDIAIDNIFIGESNTCDDPTNFAVDSIVGDRIYASWTAIGSPQQKLISGPIGFDPRIPGNSAVFSSQSGSLNNHKLGHTYDLYVQSICLTGESEMVGPLQVIIPCGDQNIPYSETFNGPVNGSYQGQFNLPICWSGITSDTNYSYIPTYQQPLSPFVRQQYAPNGGHLVLNSSGTPHNSDTTLAILPRISALTEGDKQISFSAYDFTQWWSGCFDCPYYGPYYSPGSLIIGTVSQPNDLSTFHPLDTISTFYTNYQSLITVYLDSLHGYNGQDEYLAFSYERINSPLAQQIGIDDVLVSDMPACPLITDININNVLDSSFNISFVAGSGQYLIEYDTVGFQPGSGNMDSLSSTNFTVDGLTPLTEYEFYLAQDCGLADSLIVWQGPFNVHTRKTCSPFTIPYFEDFSSNSADSTYLMGALNTHNNTTCWTDIDDSGEQGNAFGYGSLSMMNDYDYLLFYYYYFGCTSCMNSPNEVIITSPELIGLSSMNNYLSFDARNFMGTSVIEVGSMTDPGNFNTFHPLDTLTISSGFKKYGIHLDSLSGYNGTDNHIAIKQHISFFDSLATIDNVHIRPIDSCEFPTNFSVDSTGQSEAWISWVSYGSEYILEFGPVGFQKGMGIFDTLGTNSAHLTGLQPSSQYDVYLFNNCPGADSSGWVGPFTIRTDCGPIKTPYMMNFDNEQLGAAHPHCWSYYKSDSTSPSYGRNQGRYDAYSGQTIYQMEIYGYQGNDSIALISPEIQGLDSATKMIRFRARINSDLYLIIATASDPNDPKTFSVVDTMFLPYTNWGWDPYVFTLDSTTNYNMTDRYVVLLGLNNFISGLGIDDFEILDIPDCMNPYNLSVKNVGANSVTADWSSPNANLFDLKYGLPSFNPVTSGMLHSNIAATQYTISGLNPITNYEYYVRDSCNSNWVGPFAFKTKCSSIMRGVYTINGPNGSKNFTSFNAAMNKLESCGMDSTVVLELRSSNYYGNKIFDDPISGLDGSNKLIIRGLGANNTILWGRLEFDYVKNIEVEDLKIAANSPEGIKVFYSDSIKIRNCIIQSSASNRNGIEVRNGQHIVIEDNKFINLNKGIYTRWGGDILIKNNLFTNPAEGGIHVYYSNNVVMTHNTINNSASASYGALIQANNGNFNSNFINSQGKGVLAGGNNNLIANNMIVSSSVGIEMDNYSYANILHNSILSQGDAFVVKNSATVDARNNIFYGSRSFNIHDMLDVTMDHNIFYSTGSVLGKSNSETFYSMTDLLFQFPLMNNNSIYGDPIFVSSTDLHLKGGLANDMGDNLHSMATDIDSDIRPSPYATQVDIGADEYDLIAVNLATLKVIVTDDVYCEGVPLNIEAVIKNKGLDTLSAANFELFAFGNSQTITKNLNLPPFTSDTIQLGVTANALSGNQVITVIGLATGDTLNNNDTATADLFITPVSTIQITGIADSICQGDSTYYIISPSTTGSFIWVFNNDTIAVSGVNDTVWSKPVISSQSYHVFHQPDPSECKMKDTVINLNPIPMPIAAFSYIAGPPDTTSLTVQYSSNISQYTDSVFWDLGDSTFSSSAVLNHTYNKNGSYTVILYVYNDCGVDSTIKTVVIQGIDITELSASEIKVYPNPNDGTFKLDMGSLNGIYDLSIYDLQGRRIYSEKLDAKKVHSIKLDESKGVYLMTLNNGNSTIHKRVIIQ